MSSSSLDIPELEIDSLRTLAHVCRHFGSHRTIDLIQKQVHQIEIRAERENHPGERVAA